MDKDPASAVPSPQFSAAFESDPLLVQFREIAFSDAGKTFRFFFRWYTPLWLVEKGPKWLKKWILKWKPEAAEGFPWIPESFEAGQLEDMEITHQAMRELALTNPFFGGPEIRKLLAIIGGGKQVRIAEAGCGSGVPFAIAAGLLTPAGLYGRAITLLRQGRYRHGHVVHYTGIDPDTAAIRRTLSEAAVEVEKRVARGPLRVRVTLVTEPFHKARLRGRYDAIVSLKTFHHLRPLEKNLMQMHQHADSVFITDCGGWLDLPIELLAVKNHHPIFWSDAVASIINHRRARALFNRSETLRQNFKIKRGLVHTYIEKRN